MRSIPAPLPLGMAALLCGVSTLASALPQLPPVNPAPTVRRATVAAAAGTGRATQVQVDDDDAHAAFKEGAENSCAVGGCYVSFSTVAAGHRRLVEHVSCVFDVALPGLVDYAALLDTSYALPRQYMTITRNFSPGSEEFFVDASTKFPFEAGETPIISAGSEQTGIGIMQCTITGRDIVLP